MLAMKCISARFDSHDLEDTKFLIEYLQLRTPNDVFDIIQAYYPQRLIPPQTQFLIEELLPRHTDATKGRTGAASDPTEQA